MWNPLEEFKEFFRDDIVAKSSKEKEDKIRQQIDYLLCKTLDKNVITNELKVLEPKWVCIATQSTGSGTTWKIDSVWQNSPRQRIDPKNKPWIIKLNDNDSNDHKQWSFILRTIGITLTPNDDVFSLPISPHILSFGIKAIVIIIGMKSCGNGSGIDTDLKQQTSFHIFIQSLYANVIMRMADLKLHQYHTAFVSNLAHKVRTPLNGILYMGPLLAETNLTTTQYEYMSVITKSGLALAGVISDTVDISRLVFKQLPLKKEVFGIAECIEEAIQLVSDDALHKKIRIDILIEPSVPTYIYADYKKVKQILLILLQNSISFNNRMDGTGIVTLRVSASIIDNQDKMHYNLECSVSDNGMGMTEEQKNIILDSFWINLDNVSLASRPNYDSSGLGLAIAQKLTQLMDGDLWLGACELDKGTQFIFNILVEEDEYPSYITKLSLKSIKGKKALIVDSDSSVRIRLFTSLSKWGLECVLCPSYDELMTIHLRSISQSYDIMYIGESIIGACKPKDIVANIRSLREHTPIIVIQMTGDYEEKVQYRISYPIDDKELMMTTINALNTDVKTDLNLDSVHILIAEDNAINCMVLENLLPKLGYKNYTIKNNGREALAEIMSQPYQYKIVLIDIRMPIMDGITLSEEIWKYYNNMIKSPGYMPYMIGVSAQPMVPGDSMGKLKTFVSKPIDIKKMDQALSEALRDHS